MEKLSIIDVKRRNGTKETECIREGFWFAKNSAEGSLLDDMKGSKSKKHKPESPGKTIETMFKITSGNSQRLSDQADTKSHIMITVNALIVTFLVGKENNKSAALSYSTWPLLLLLMVSLVTIIFSMLATKPRIPQGSFTLKDITEKKTNLLFFGNFYRMNFEQYSNGMMHIMNDKSFLYSSLLRDLYCQGIVLGKKYKMLKIAYNVFMYGMIGAVVGFLVQSFFTPLI